MVDSGRLALKEAGEKVHVWLPSLVRSFRRHARRAQTFRLASNMLAKDV